ncbi:MAG: MerR family transcriptional regulator [Pseudomonadota bacterium]
MHEDKLFPIRTVSQLTGVNPITIRAWERRYGLIKPHRTPKGHRLYTQEDIDLIIQVVTLLEQGMSVSQARQTVGTPTRSAEKAPEPDDYWGKNQRRMINAIARYDELALDATYNDALSLYPIDVVTARLITPLLKTLGERWQDHDSGIAEEHFFGAYLRNKLGARLHHMSRQTHGPKVIAACLPEEYHEVGLLLFCISLANQGYRLVLLGGNMPLEQIPLVAERSGADAVVLSGSVDPPKEVLAQQLPAMMERLRIPVLIGGQVAVNHSDVIARAGAHIIGTDLGMGLRRLSELLPDSAVD